MQVSLAQFTAFMEKEFLYTDAFNLYAKQTLSFDIAHKRYYFEYRSGRGFSLFNNTGLARDFSCIIDEKDLYQFINKTYQYFISENITDRCALENIAPEYKIYRLINRHILNAECDLLYFGIPDYSAIFFLNEEMLTVIRTEDYKVIYNGAESTGITVIAALKKMTFKVESVEIRKPKVEIIRTA